MSTTPNAEPYYYVPQPSHWPILGSIADENQRYYSSRNIFQHWIQYDRPAAEKWIASVNITDAKRQEILKMK